MQAPAVTVEPPVEKVASEPFVIQVATETPSGAEEVIQEEVAPALEVVSAGVAAPESVAGDATAPPDAPLSDAPVEAPLVEENVAPTITVPVIDEASAVPEAVVDPAAVFAQESIPSTESAPEVDPTEVAVESKVDVPVDNVVEVCQIFGFRDNEYLNHTAGRK